MQPLVAQVVVNGEDAHNDDACRTAGDRLDDDFLIREKIRIDIVIVMVETLFGSKYDTERCTMALAGLVSFPAPLQRTQLYMYKYHVQ